MAFDQRQVSSVAELLLANRSEAGDFWHWLTIGVEPELKAANKFFLGCILDYQIRAAVAWENSRRLAEDILGDPDNLWVTIVSCELEEWNKRRSDYSLHRFPKGHERVWTIGRRLVDQYGGDVRNIWREQSMDAVLYRLNDLKVGEAISRMIAGALSDTGQITGRSDVKPDVHVSRVLGRVFTSEPYGADESQAVIGLTRQMHPKNPWDLDRPLYLLGKSHCKATDPRCASCFLREICLYTRRTP